MSSSTPTGFIVENPWIERLTAVVAEVGFASAMYLTDVVGPEWGMALGLATPLVTVGMHYMTCPRKAKQTLMWNQERINHALGTPWDLEDRVTRLGGGNGELQFQWSRTLRRKDTWQGSEAFDHAPLHEQPTRVRVRAEGTSTHEASDWVEVTLEVEKARQYLVPDQLFTITYGDDLGGVRQQIQRVNGDGDITIEGVKKGQLTCAGSPHPLTARAGKTSVYQQSEPVTIWINVLKAPQEVEWTRREYEIVYGTNVSTLVPNAKLKKGDPGNTPLVFPRDAVPDATPMGATLTLTAWAQETGNYLKSPEVEAYVTVKKAPGIPPYDCGDITITYGDPMGRALTEFRERHPDLPIDFEPIDPNEVRNAGQYSIRAWTQETTNHFQSSEVRVRVIVRKAPQTINANARATFNYRQAIAVAGWAAACTSGAVVTCDQEGELRDAGDYNDIILRAPETNNYLPEERRVACRVEPINNEITWDTGILERGQTLNDLPVPTALGGAHIGFSLAPDTRLEPDIYEVTLTAAAVLPNYRETAAPFTVTVRRCVKEDFAAFIVSNPVGEIDNLDAYIGEKYSKLLKAFNCVYGFLPLELAAFQVAFDEAKMAMVVRDEGVVRPDPIEPPKGEYIGGGADAPHIHRYGGGLHLKLPHRFNIVQGGVFYKNKYQDAMAALHDHPRREWADRMMGHIEWLLINEHGDPPR